MADQKLTALDAATTLGDADLVYVVDDVAGTATSKKLTGANLKAAVGSNVTARPQSAVSPQDTIAVDPIVLNQSAQINNTVLTLWYFIAERQMTVSRIATVTAGTAASGVGLARMGIYEAVTNDPFNLSLVARTNSDPAFEAAETVFEKQFDTAGGYPADFTLQGGQLYAAAMVYSDLSGAAHFRMTQSGPFALRDYTGLPYAATSTGHSDLPATLTTGINLFNRILAFRITA